jgi:hypothetical protein
MNRFLSTKPLLAATLGLAALAAVPAAHARSDVFFSIGINAPVGYAQPVYVQPQPVYVEPRPVYVQPRPVYVQPRPVYVQPRPVYADPRWVHYEPRHGHHGGERRGAWGDFDRDGVPNRHDRAPGNPYRH